MKRRPPGAAHYDGRPMKVLTDRAGGMGVMALVAALVASCAAAASAPNAPRRPPLAEDCPIQLFPATHPSYAVVDLAPVQVVCNRGLGRAPCLEKLRRQACATGADTAYGFNEGISPDGAGMVISATVAVRREAPAGRPGAVTAAPVEEDSGSACAPICSPGFACQAGQCIPQCNPACEPTEICNRHRICEPARAIPAPAQ